MKKKQKKEKIIIKKHQKKYILYILQSEMKSAKLNNNEIIDVFY